MSRNIGGTIDVSGFAALYGRRDRHRQTDLADIRLAADIAAGNSREAFKALATDLTEEELAELDRLFSQEGMTEEAAQTALAARDGRAVLQAHLQAEPIKQRIRAILREALLRRIDSAPHEQE
jgi:hypothetical protein